MRSLASFECMCHINVLSSESTIESSSVSVWKKRATKDRCPYHFQLRSWWGMKILGQGRRRLLAWRDPDDQRRWVLMNKPRRIEDKRVNLSDAVAKYVRDGDYIAIGGFGHVRVSMASVYEIIRQRKRKLTMVGKPGVHDFDLLIASGCVSIVEVAYGFGHELRGLSRASRRAAETGRIKIGAEISNAAGRSLLRAIRERIQKLSARSLNLHQHRCPLTFIRMQRKTIVRLPSWCMRRILTWKSETTLIN